MCCVFGLPLLLGLQLHVARVEAESDFDALLVDVELHHA